mmetsp:Transcript_16293/g.26508  ORF Transcript_16293/g.26508 Transcript_16293/m.26508 type:complete len:216 (-) Transcript_16293:217-864(-)
MIVQNGRYKVVLFDWSVKDLKMFVKIGDTWALMQTMEANLPVGFISGAVRGTIKQRRERRHNNFGTMVNLRQSIHAHTRASSGFVASRWNHTRSRGDDWSWGRNIISNRVSCFLVCFVQITSISPPIKGFGYIQQGINIGPFCIPGRSVLGIGPRRVHCQVRHSSRRDFTNCGSSNSWLVHRNGDRIGSCLAGNLVDLLLLLLRGHWNRRQVAEK